MSEPQGLQRLRSSKKGESHSTTVCTATLLQTQFNTAPSFFVKKSSSLPRVAARPWGATLFHFQLARCFSLC